MSPSSFCTPPRVRAAASVVPSTSLPSIADESFICDSHVPTNLGDIPSIPDETLFGPNTTPLRPRARDGTPRTPFLERVKRGNDNVRGWMATQPLPLSYHPMQDYVAPSEYVTDWIKEQAASPIVIPTAQWVDEVVEKVTEITARVKIPDLDSPGEDRDRFYDIGLELSYIAFWERSPAVFGMSIDGGCDMTLWQKILQAVGSDDLRAKTESTGPWVLVTVLDEGLAVSMVVKVTFIDRCIDHFKVSEKKESKKSSGFMKKLKAVRAKLF